ncbi:tyrosine-type recombinase/integrase [Streptomyces albidoflavus]|uniref:tyrosine-type recombinase/integrase n=1 Tax=Streptomyces TaxID=1883 RepID=UPI001BE9B191|nr:MULTISPECIES: tyrosine-type recombinase/integrase [unclassified Streptomyces]MBT2879505.1 tyrosine-type recombinase/integrase [Streptomyces sp. McG6]MBT2886606.1 tyrosine-type recombinase/integrase [Streptomyces sp. McG5]MBT2889258.1 tyrosine-type recombinase/integrase [Streptomyces sp. McG2]WSB18099.1 site-specific integrase [Streptomyces albidoflavus]
MIESKLTGAESAKSQQEPEDSTLPSIPKQLARGMGSFAKACGCSQPTRCRHPYFIRYRDAGGKQREESGFRTQDAAKDRLVELYARKATTPASKAELIRHYGQMRFEDLVGDYLGRQRRLSYATAYEYEHLARNHLIPELGSRRVETFSPMVVENYLTTMDRLGTPSPTQFKVYVLLKTLLLDAHRKGAINEHPLQDVDAPRYEASRAVVPTPEQIAGIKAAANHDRFSMFVDMMAGCGLRNGEALALNVNNIVADDVYRVLEKLKHRKPGEFREVPLPRSIREAIERFVEKNGTTEDGYVLQGARAKHMNHSTINAIWYRKLAGKALDMP